MSGPVNEFELRRRALAVELARHKADALLVSSLPNVRYLTGYTGSNGLLLLSRSGEATFFTDPRYRIAAAEEVNCPIKVSTGPILPDVLALVARRKIRRLGFEKSSLGYEQYEFLKSRLPVRCVLQPLANLVETDMQGFRCKECKLDRVEMGFTKLSGAAFKNCTFTQASFHDVKLDGVRFIEATLSGATFELPRLSGAYFEGARLDKAKFSCEKISGVNFSRTDLRGADFTGVEIVKCDFQKADLSNTRFENATLTDCDFSSADLSTVIWSAENLKNNRYDGQTRFPRSYIMNPGQMRLK